MAVLTPQPKMQFTTAAGVPLSGGKVYTYTAGTTTPQATFTDYTGATPNPNPVILDSRGEANIWLGGALYKFKLTDANDVEIWTVDYISAPTSSVSAVLSGNVTIDSDTPGPALKITQTGTGPVLRVQDSADPDATPFIIDNAGNVGIGTAVPTVQLEATGAAKIGSLTLTGSPLPVASGGTGQATLTANNVLIGAGTGNVTFVAPGTSGNVLTSNGTLWSSQPLPADRSRQEVFNTSGTWTKPSGLSANSPVYIQVWSAGGSGARGAAGSSHGGGGGGGYAERWTVLSALGATETITVGVGGAARTGSNQNGAAGGNSSVGSFIVVYGGGGGVQLGTGGTGGGLLSNLALAGVLRTGGNGGNSDSGDPLLCPALYGGGGGAGLGNGGINTFPGNLSPIYGGNGGASSATIAGSGTAPGGGGGAALGTSGAGAAGRVIITVFPGV